MTPGHALTLDRTDVENVVRCDAQLHKVERELAACKSFDEGERVLRHYCGATGAACLHLVDGKVGVRQTSPRGAKCAKGHELGGPSLLLCDALPCHRRRIKRMGPDSCQHPPA